MKNTIGYGVAIKQQRGMVMIVTLMMVVIMTLAGVAMVRTSDTSKAIAANMAFRESTTKIADLGLEAARAWVLQNNTPSTCGAASGGYFPYWGTGASGASQNNILQFDEKNYGWTTSGQALVFTPGQMGITSGQLAGYTVRAVVHCMCPPGATEVKMQCLVGTAKGNTNYGSMEYAKNSEKRDGGVAIYRRITVRVDGPRNSLTYLQSMML